MYTISNTCFYHDSTNTWTYFSQEECVTQGCSLSGMLSCLGLHPVLQACSSLLTTFSPTLPPIQLAYLDDVSSVLPPTAVPTYFSTFQQVGTPIGAHLNPSKTTILFTLDPQFPNQHPSLPLALQLLPASSHLNHGTSTLLRSCHSKLLLSNALRNAVWAICYATSSLVLVTTSHYNVPLEPQHLYAIYPLARPTDVGLKLHPSYLTTKPANPRFSCH